jgi:cobalamin biosynthetic protein CobC
MTDQRDHGGGLDAAVARWGGARADWLDLSTGINPVPYPLGDFQADIWTALPDRGAMDRLEVAARAFWGVPDGAAVVAAPGASALIARMPGLNIGAAFVPGPTYNEHAAAFVAVGRSVMADDVGAGVQIVVHPNNPDGRVWGAAELSGRELTVIDESFCDVMPEASHIGLTNHPGIAVLKSFGKFWGLAGLRLGFLIGAEATIAPMRQMLGPWAVSGPAIAVGSQALNDPRWAGTTRTRLAADAARLDGMLTDAGAMVVGGTDLFRLYEVDDAAAWQDRLGRGHVLSRMFPYSRTWLRLGLPHPARWEQLQAAL